MTVLNDEYFQLHKPEIQTIYINGIPYSMVAVTKPGDDEIMVKVMLLSHYYDLGWKLL